MKLFFPTLTLTATLAALPLAAQQVPAPPAPPAAPGKPAAAPGASAPVPGAPVPRQAELLPPPITPPPVKPDGFKSDKERQSYALGLLFSNNLKQEQMRSGTALPKPDEVLKGLKDVLSGKTPMDYVIGAHLASQIRLTEVDLDADVLSAAITDALTNAAPKLDPQQSQEAMKKFNEERTKKRKAKQEAENAAALVESKKFLDGNAKAEGVKQSPSGLQYTVQKEGTGKSPADTDLVTINFKSTLLDTTLVEKSPDTGPARKVMRSLPKGLQEGLKLLKTGSKAKFWLPPDLGFGEAGRLGLVKSNAVVVYEVELLGVEPAPKPAMPSTPGAGLQPHRPPVTAVTPPISVEIPPRPGTPVTPPKPGEKPQKPLDPPPPVRPVPPASTPPVQVPPPPAPSPNK